MFNENDYVFYGTVGVGKIEKISELDFGEKGKLYYVVKPVDNRLGTIYALVDSDKVVMRSIISKHKAKELMDNIPNVEEVEFEDRKFQALEYRETEKAGDYEKWMGMLKKGYINKKKKLAEGRKLLNSEEQIFRSAEGLLIQEFAVAMDMPEDEVKDYILKKVAEVDS